jgi:ribosomal protein L32
MSGSWTPRAFHCTQCGELKCAPRLRELGYYKGRQFVSVEA